jgi:hypothetical protein
MSSSDKYTGKDGWRNISTNSVVKEYGGMPNFMASHGLKPYNTEDFGTARQIIDTMKQGQWSSMSSSEKSQARAHRDKYGY